MKKLPPALLLVCCCFGPRCLYGQEEVKPGEDVEAIHEELRALRKQLTDALNAGDVERQLTFVNENVVTTWQNAEVTRGRDGLKAFLNKTNARGQVFQGYKEPPTADDLSLLYGGDTAIAFGSSVPHYKLLGMEFDLKNRWTATLVKQDGRWLIASYHVSTNVLDNPLLSAAKKSAYWAGAVALLIGIALGVAGDRVFRKGRGGTAQPRP